METRKADTRIDITQEICPMTYVKTKLKLETMTPGQVLSIELDDGIPARNVHKSLMLEPVEILTREEIEKGVRLVIRKR